MHTGQMSWNLCWCVSSHRLYSLNIRSFFLAVQNCRSETKLWAGLDSPEASFLGLQMVSSWCIFVCICVLVSSDNASGIGPGPTPVLLFISKITLFFTH